MSDLKPTCPQQDNHLPLLRDRLDQQHPFAGMFGQVFERLGGEEFLYEWGEANPGAFIRMMVGLMPAVAPTSARTGELTININSSLGRTELDEKVVYEVEDGNEAQ